jgi:hypothetical protein
MKLFVMENGEIELASFGTGSALKSKYGIFKSSKGTRLGPWTHDEVEVQSGAPWRVCTL